MPETIIVAIASLVGTAISGLLGMRLVLYRIEQLEKKMEKHNNIIERVYVLEGAVKEICHDLTDLKHREQ